MDDVEAIRTAALRYAHGLDRLDPVTMRRAYWPDATHDHGPRGVLRAWDWVDLAVQSHATWAATMHCVTNHLVEVDPDGTHARGECYCVAYLFAEGHRALHTWFGRYLDRYERRGDEWRIVERVTVHEGGRTDDPLPALAFPVHGFRQGAADRGVPGRPIGP